MKESRDYDDDRTGRATGRQRSRSRDRERTGGDPARRDRKAGGTRKSKFDLSSPKNRDQG